jgi:hypothetical protein
MSSVVVRVRACVRACVRVCVRARVCLGRGHSWVIVAFVPGIRAGMRFLGYLVSERRTRQKGPTEPLGELGACMSVCVCVCVCVYQAVRVHRPQQVLLGQPLRLHDGHLRAPG